MRLNRSGMDLCKKETGWNIVNSYNFCDFILILFHRFGPVLMDLCTFHFEWSRSSERFKSQITSHSAYIATSTESDGVKIDGFLFPNFMYTANLNPVQPCESIPSGKPLFWWQGSCFHYRDFPVNPCTSLLGITV